MERNELRDLIDSEESPKLDFKRETWKLDAAEGKSEFIKDILAISNSLGGTGYLIIGVGDEASRPLRSIDNQGLTEERLQQIAKEYIEPPVDFSYEEIKLHGTTIGVIKIPPSSAKPHWARKSIGTVRDRTFYTRRGSTTDFATLNEVERMIRNRPTASQQAYGGWTVGSLWNCKEHLRVVPCLFLEKWDREGTSVMSTDEIQKAVEARTGKTMKLQGAGNLVASFNQKANRQGWAPLFEQVDDKAWRLPEPYVALFREYCRTYKSSS